MQARYWLADERQPIVSLYKKKHLGWRAADLLGGLRPQAQPALGLKLMPNGYRVLLVNVSESVRFLNFLPLYYSDSDENFTDVIFKLFEIFPSPKMFNLRSP